MCGKHAFYVTPHNGFSYCFVCNHKEQEGETTQEEQKPSEHVAEIRALYKQAAQYYHSALTPEAYRFLQSRGFSDTTIQDRQIGYCPVGTMPFYKHVHAKEAGLATADNQAFLAHRITFPYFFSADTIVDIRARTMDNDEELRYKSPFGNASFRGAIYPYNYHLKKQRTIIITEGEIKADISTQYGFPAMALPGISTWRKGFKQRADTTYILLYDSQKNMQHVRRAIRTIAQKIDDVRIATLPLMGQDKMDIDSFILRFGISAYRTVVHSALDFTTWNQLQR